MTKREVYNLKFYKGLNGFGTIEHMIDASDAVGLYARLFFIDILYPIEIESFIHEIELIENNQPYDPEFLISGGTEGIHIEFVHPNVIIDFDLIIHMSDFKELLIEWREFRTEDTPTKKETFIAKILRKLQAIKTKLYS
ncbi:hypothetical protein DVK85_05045 [Flavobacterium arcticum]|uniref:Uncharacterized protein n=1 Tax=Flavobacterium arcticum TaxID=1784713 RepID=A0A345HAM0_9FLAO|nr:hypothetical protein [Flavobacterium arcticum]AXG73630.1 hypothetical protein DVK85_05045 [Flavobacterium arcticum]KAF2511580.1 hypothetical protein E0W72_04555 [Flavobacterium arcticum]